MTFFFIYYSSKSEYIRIKGKQKYYCLTLDNNKSPKIAVIPRQWIAIIQHGLFFLPKVTFLIQTAAFLERSEIFQIINMQAHLPHRICIHVLLACFHLCPSVWMAPCLLIKHDGLWWAANICLSSLLYTTWSDIAIQKCYFKNKVKASNLWQSVLYFISVQYLQSTLKHVLLTKSTTVTKPFKKKQSLK